MQEIRILIADDDKTICEIVKLYLEQENYLVDIAYNGTDVLGKVSQNEYNLIILDIVMPEMDGYETCIEIRKKSDVPIIFLSSKTEIKDKVYGLEIGADDYIVKPFETKEFIARVKSKLRRNAKNAVKIIAIGNLEVSLEDYSLKIDGNAKLMPPKEIELLYFLVLNKNHVFSREDLLKNVWGFEFLGDSRTVDVHIKRIREKIDGYSTEWSLETVWGIGYKFSTRL